jgi:hypothetical protein
MRRGQIGTDAEGRVFFVWEGLVAVLPDHRLVRGLERLATTTGQFRRAVDYWKVQDRALALMWSLNQRTPWRIDLVVTTRGPAFTKALSEKVTQENWPVRYVTYDTPQSLGRALSYMPDVQRVYYGLEEQRFAYGPHGFFCGPDTPLTVS